MARIYRDDITDKEVASKKQLGEYGLFTDYGQFDSIDVTEETVNNHPDKVAKRLHDMVDVWLEDRKTFIEESTEDGHLTKCHSCDYKWHYGGSQEKATCPNCGNKTRANND